MKYKFSASLSEKSINNLINELNNYRDNILRDKVSRLAQRLAEQGVEFAKANVKTYDAIFTGELLSSIHTMNGGTTTSTAIFYVITDSRHAAFVEFGTGQIGQEAPYPYPLPPGVEWHYNTGRTIFEVSEGQYGWFYPRDGKWYFTQGMPARPYMYEASIAIQSIILKTVKEVFG